MKRFVIKTAIYFAIVCGGYIVAMFLVPLLIVLPEIPNKDYSEIKRAEVIVCGDSRADIQVDPAIVHNITGLNTINIANPAWDIYSVTKNFEPLKLENKIILLSASSCQVNDGNVSHGYFKTETFMGLTFWQKIKLFKFNINDFYYNQNQTFKTHLFEKSKSKTVGKDFRKMNVDYNSKDCSDYTADNRWFKNHPWYKKILLDGVNKELVIEGIKNLSLLKNNKIIIYNGPVSPDFYAAAKNNGIYEVEKKFDDFMFAECSKYPNIQYYSFLESKDYVHNDFYDPQHLCKQGAGKFSKKIGELINQHK